MNIPIKFSSTDTGQLILILNWIADYASRGDLPNQGEPGDGSNTDYVINFAEELSDKIDEERRRAVKQAIKLADDRRNQFKQEIES